MSGEQVNTTGIIIILLYNLVPNNTMDNNIKHSPNMYLDSVCVLNNL